MGDALDQFSKSLASGASRRRAIGALLAGSALAIPLTAEGRKRKNRKKKKLQQKFAPFQKICDDWCKINSQLPNSSINYGLCLKDAKQGKGPCFSTSAGGAGAVCLSQCSDDEFCCPTLFAEGTVAFVQCCTSPCNLSVNNTLICNP